MTTASIYYQPASSEPSFVLIDGEYSSVLSSDYGPAGRDLVGARIGAIDHACRRLGWKVADTAPIVRQADGRATIRIEPLPELLAAADEAVDASNGRAVDQLANEPVVAYIESNDGIPLFVSVAGETGAVHTQTVNTNYHLNSALAENADRARQSVSIAFAALGYTQVEKPVPDGLGRGRTIQVTKVVKDQPADWRDVPTMVGIDDDASNDLNELSAKLGIPGDILASAWITEAAQNARSRHARFTEPGYIMDPSRITGWMADGTPHLDHNNDGTVSYAHRRFIHPRG